MRKKILLSSIAVIGGALIGAGVWWLFNTGRLVYVANPGASHTIAAVCDDSVVDKYNTAMYYQVRSGSTTPSIDSEGVKTLAKEIKAKAGYETDATCQVLLFWIDVRNDDYKAARSAYVVIKDLHDKGIYPNSNIRTNDPLFTYEGYVNGLSGSGAPQDNGVEE